MNHHQSYWCLSLRNPRFFGYSYKNLTYDIWLYLISFSHVLEYKIILEYACYLLINFQLTGHCQNYQKTSRLFKNWFYPNEYVICIYIRSLCTALKRQTSAKINHYLEEALSSLLSCAREAPHPSDRFH